MDPRAVKSIEDARRIVEQRSITHIKVGLFDIDGVMRGKYMNKAKFFYQLYISIVVLQKLPYIKSFTRILLSQNRAMNKKKQQAQRAQPGPPMHREHYQFFRKLMLFHCLTRCSTPAAHPPVQRSAAAVRSLVSFVPNLF